LGLSWIVFLAGLSVDLSPQQRFILRDPAFRKAIFDVYRRKRQIVEGAETVAGNQRKKRNPEFLNIKRLSI
jgi:hypothetical protein